MKGLQVTKKVRSYKKVCSYEKGTKLRKRYEVTKKVRSYEKGEKLRKRYEVTNMVGSYEKGTMLRKRYEVTKNVRSYEHGTKLRKRYEVTKRVRRCYEISGLGYEVTKLRDSNATYRDNLLWRLVMHYGEMPRATLGSSDLRSQVAIFGEWNIYGTRKKSFVKFQTSYAYLKKKTVQLTKSWKAIKKQTAPNLSTSNGINVEIR